MKKVIVIDWYDIKSIRLAERKKVRLENSGWTLVEEQATPTTSSLTYVRED